MPEPLQGKNGLAFPADKRSGVKWNLPRRELFHGGCEKTGYLRATWRDGREARLDEGPSMDS